MPNSALQISLKIGEHILTAAELNNIGELSYEESLTEMAELEFSLMASASFDFNNLPLVVGEKVELKIGWLEGELVSLFEGNIQKLASSFVSGGPGGVTVTCYDRGYELRRMPEPHLYTNISRLGLIKEICRRHNMNPILKGAKETKSTGAIKQEHGFFDSVTETLQEVSEWVMEHLFNEKVESVTQYDETDFEILATIAQDGNLNLLVHGDNLFIVKDEYMATPAFHDAVRPGSTARKFRFVHNPTPEDEAAENTWPLISFEPEFGTEGQRAQVQVKTWSSTSDSGLNFGKGTLKRSRTGVGYTEVVLKFQTGGMHDKVEHLETVRILGKTAENSAQARYLAVNELDRRAKEFVTAEVVPAIGTPHLHLGMPVDIVTRGLQPFGRMFSGEYIITAVRLEINSDGSYSTPFDVRRDGVTA